MGKAPDCPTWYEASLIGNVVQTRVWPGYPLSDVAAVTCALQKVHDPEGPGSLMGNAKAPMYAVSMFSGGYSFPECPVIKENGNLQVDGNKPCFWNMPINNHLAQERALSGHPVALASQPSVPESTYWFDSPVVHGAELVFAAVVIWNLVRNNLPKAFFGALDNSVHRTKVYPPNRPMPPRS